MNVYDCVYNNVVDFNNAINSLWPQGVDTIANGNITTAKDSLSNLPQEILIEIMTYLPLESVQALSLTNHKIKPTTEPIIKFRTNLKTQELLETYKISPRNFTPEMREIYKEDIEKAKTFQNGSDERVQALRDVICSLYQGNIRLDTLFSPFNHEGIFTDKPLVEQLMKNLNADYLSFQYNYDKINNKKLNHNKINNEILFLNLLKTNQIHPKELDIEIFNVSFVPKELAESLTDALRENESINTVTISWQDCDLIQLEAILETIKNNERILKFEIRDIGSKRNCSGKEWSWEKTTKEKNYKEFEDLIKNKLNSTFQIQEPDDYGFFRCERLPV